MTLDPAELAGALRDLARWAETTAPVTEPELLGRLRERQRQRAQIEGVEHGDERGEQHDPEHARCDPVGHPHRLFGRAGEPRIEP